MVVVVVLVVLGRGVGVVGVGLQVSEGPLFQKCHEDAYRLR